MFADDVEFSFPGDNSWATEFRPLERGRQVHVTHRGTAEMERFLQRYVAAGLQMEVEDILVNGPPWNMRAAVRVHDWHPAIGRRPLHQPGSPVRHLEWGKLRTQEDYEDTERAAAFDALLDGSAPVSQRIAGLP